MFVKYKISNSNLDISSRQISEQTPTTPPVFTGDISINIPINLEYQIVDNGELIERLFVDTETKKSVNKILDYEKFRFSPVDKSNKKINDITFNFNFLVGNNTIPQPTYFSDLTYEDLDIKFLKSNFTESYALLSFYDTDNNMTQNLINEIQI
jgi:hypothetical protein